MATIKNIFIIHEKGMEALVPYVRDAINGVMDCFPAYKEYFPIINLGDWKSDYAYSFQNGQLCLRPHESMAWYLTRAKQKAVQENRWQVGKQINVVQMLEDLSNDPYRDRIPQWGIYLTKQDLYGGRASNFCLGVTRPDAFTIISTKHFLNDNNQLDTDNFQTIVQHEFGHILGVTEGDRPNTYESLGAHCSNSYCVMQQRLSGDVTDITAHRLQRKAVGLHPLCPDCINQGTEKLAKLFQAYTERSIPNNISNLHNPAVGRD